MPAGSASLSLSPLSISGSGNLNFSLILTSFLCCRCPRTPDYTSFNRLNYICPFCCPKHLLLEWNSVLFTCESKQVASQWFLSNLLAFRMQIISCFFSFPNIKMKFTAVTSTEETYRTRRKRRVSGKNILKPLHHSKNREKNIQISNCIITIAGII